MGLSVVLKVNKDNSTSEQSQKLHFYSDNLKMLAADKVIHQSRDGLCKFNASEKLLSEYC